MQPGVRRLTQRILNINNTFVAASANNLEFISTDTGQREFLRIRS